MTSQKSLKNNVNKNDFKRSFLGALPFPAIAFAVLFTMVTIPVIQHVTAEEFLRASEHFEYTMFLAPYSTFYYSFELLPVGMIVCGMLTALKSFYFLLSKKQVNVYLSLGVKRNTMFTNRLIAGVISLFLAVFLPIFIIYIINIVNFGISAHLTKLFIYFVSLLFVCGLTGYSLVSAMMMVSGNIFEAVIASGALSVTPLFVFYTVHSLTHGYLKGYIRVFDFTSAFQAFTPWTMAVNMKREFIGEYGELVSPRTILGLLMRDTTPDKFKVPAEFNMDWGFILPVVIWFVVSLGLIGVTYYLFNKRKAEHANSLGKFPVSRAIIGTSAFTGIAWIFTEWFGGLYNISAYFVLTVAVGLVAYFLVQLILTRKPKTALKSMKWCVVIVGALAVCSIIINTQLLGTYNKIPDKADVKSVTIETTQLSVYPHYIYPWNMDEDFVESSTDESKEAVLKAYELLKNEDVKYDEESITSVTLGVRDNDGKIKFREFDVFSEETYLKYIQLVYGSEYFDEILKNYLIDDIPENPENDSTGYLKRFDWAYTDKDMIIKTDETLNMIKDVDGLCEALYKDLSEMSVDELFKNNNKPVGVLVNISSDVDYPGYVPAYVNSGYYPESAKGPVMYADDRPIEEIDYKHALVGEYISVYENMTNTLRFLKDNGYELATEPMEITEVLYTDGKMSLQEAKREFGKANEDSNRGWTTYEEMFYDYKGMFLHWHIAQYCCDSCQYFIDETTNEYDMINRVYKDAGHPLKSVKDTEKMEEIVNGSVSQYLTVNDNGRYVYVIYEDSVIVGYYLPEANVNVVK